MNGPAILLALAAWTATGEPLPAVGDVSWPQFRQQTLELLQTLGDSGLSLPAESRQALGKLLAVAAPTDPAGSVALVQKLLDPLCLVGVSINPESRVKVGRGPAPAQLRLGQDALLLVKVHNDAGVTHALAVSGPQVRARDRAEEGRWLSATVVAPPRLSGQKLEYALLRLRPHEMGKREATLRFDVGQGSQDLGFRGETPILFRVLSAQSK